MITNAIIKEANITFWDDSPKGFLTAWVDLDFGGYGQAVGGNALYLKDRYDCTGTFVARMMQVAGVTRWDKLVGKSIRVKHDQNSKIEAVGHIIHDDWFVPAVDLGAKYES